MNRPEQRADPANQSPAEQQGDDSDARQVSVTSFRCQEDRQQVEDDSGEETDHQGNGLDFVLAESGEGVGHGSQESDCNYDDACDSNYRQADALKLS